MFEDWSRQELLQLGAIVSSATAAIAATIGVKMVRTVHVMINSRMGQIIAGAQAQGQVKERDEAQERHEAKKD